MEIRISDFVSKDSRHKVVDYEYNGSDFEFEGDVIKYDSPCKITGEVTSESDIIVLKANIKTNLKMRCSRCLEAFIYPVDIDIEERFTTDESLFDEEDVTVVSDDVIDVTEIAQKSIISSLPIKRLCKDDCKGICQVCGCNLNYNKCNCQKEDVDIRLESLKSLFNNKEV
ncbi:DUF177 domain-containing protein [Clostridium sp. BJN0001]|uniref:YceD family protein n=1 Tax=Clostridium sp. BJN0001 TaxID=2930219 RepID=UPI001FD17105|nr:DUF177 domain-containing protein [Clostridium sp. BJN0001]